MTSRSDPLEHNRCAELLSALASPDRLGIVRLLVTGETNVRQITDTLGIAPLSVSHNLNALKQSHLIEARKDGRFVYYCL